MKNKDIWKLLYKNLKEKKYLAEFKEDSALFNLIMASTYSNIPIMEKNIAILKSFIKEGTNDFGMDVVIKKGEVSGKTHYIFIQSKSGFSETKINVQARDWLTTKALLFFDKKVDLPEHLKEIREDILKDEKTYVTFIWASTKPKEDYESETWTIFRDAFKSHKHNKTAYLLKPAKSLLYDVIKFITTGVFPEVSYRDKPKITFENTKEKDVLSVIGKEKSYIFDTNLSIFASKIKHFDREIFSENVRFGLGNNKINKGISATISGDESQYTHLFNNGIIILASKVDFTRSGDMNIWNAQIINGAQTMSTALSSLSNDTINNDAKVIVKVIETNDKELRTKISKYSNSQSSINGRDLLSNQDEQIQVQKYFIEQGILIERKRGEFNNAELFKNFTKFSNEDLAKSYTATFLKLPSYPVSKVSDFFNIDKDLYSQIFLSHNSYLEYVNAIKIYDFVNETIFNENRNKYSRWTLMQYVWKHIYEDIHLEKNVFIDDLILQAIKKEELINEYKKHMEKAENKYPNDIRRYFMEITHDKI